MKYISSNSSIEMIRLLLKYIVNAFLVKMCQSDMGDPVEIHIHVELEHSYYNQGC